MAIIWASVKFWNFCSNSCFKALPGTSYTFLALMTLGHIWKSLRTCFNHLFTTEIYLRHRQLIGSLLSSHEWTSRGYRFICRKSLPILSLRSYPPFTNWPVTKRLTFTLFFFYLRIVFSIKNPAALAKTCTKYPDNESIEFNLLSKQKAYF